MSNSESSYPKMQHGVIDEWPWKYSQGDLNSIKNKIVNDLSEVLRRAYLYQSIFRQMLIFSRHDTPFYSDCVWSIRLLMIVRGGMISILRRFCMGARLHRVGIGVSIES